MNDLRRSTITSMEVAEMMETEHWKLLRKIDGGKDRKGYVQILTDNQMGVSDYFIPSSYTDASGKENKCYEVTKLGCDFLANKSTGEKGVLFTARYVKRFYEMEHQVKQIPITEHPGDGRECKNSCRKRSAGVHDCKKQYGHPQSQKRSGEGSDRKRRTACLMAAGRRKTNDRLNQIIAPEYTKTVWMHA